MRKTEFRPTYQFQAKRVVWEAEKTWASVRGNCKAIARYPGNQFFVLVERSGQNQWMPIERVLNESDVYRWIRSCNINLYPSLVRRCHGKLPVQQVRRHR